MEYSLLNTVKIKNDNFIRIYKNIYEIKNYILMNFPLYRIHLIETFNIILYAIYSPILIKYFFPIENENISYILSFLSVAITFMMRPLGGLMLGYIGDLYGRKKALGYSILPVSIATMAIGFLPTYESMGVISIIGIFLCRIIQGLCGGGEYAGAIIYSYENADIKEKNFMCSLTCASGFLGALFGSISIFLSFILPLPDNYWRFPFILGGVLGVFAYINRKKLKNDVNKNPIVITKKDDYHIIHIFYKFRKEILSIFFVGINCHIPLYISTIYLNTILIKNINISHFTVSICNMTILLLWVLLIPMVGMLSDKLGGKNLILISSIVLSVIPFPLFLFIEIYPCLFSVFIAQIFISLAGILFIAPSSSFMCEIFNPPYRYTGVAFSLTLGKATIGGASPLIAKLIEMHTRSFSCVSIILILGGICGIFSYIIYIKNISKF